MAYIRRLCSPQLTYAPQGMKATAIPAGTSPQVITSPPAGDCEGAEPTLFPALLPGPGKHPSPVRGGPPTPPIRNTPPSEQQKSGLAVTKPRKTACIL